MNIAEEHKGKKNFRKVPSGIRTHVNYISSQYRRVTYHSATATISKLVSIMVFKFLQKFRHGIYVEVIEIRKISKRVYIIFCRIS